VCKLPFDIIGVNRRLSQIAKWPLMSSVLQLRQMRGLTSRPLASVTYTGFHINVTACNVSPTWLFSILTMMNDDHCARNSESLKCLQMIFSLRTKRVQSLYCSTLKTYPPWVWPRHLLMAVLAMQRSPYIDQRGSVSIASTRDTCVLKINRINF
jgi:hypothetical protein